MLGVPIQPGCSDSQDLNRTIETLVSRDRLSLAEAMEMVVPPIVEEIRSLPEDLHRFYMYLHQAMGPFAQGPVALIARHADECVFSADALGLRPLWQVETESDFVFSSSPASSRSERWSPSRSRWRRGRRRSWRSTESASARRCAPTRRCCGSSGTAGCAATASRRPVPTTARSRPGARSRVARCRATPKPARRSPSRSPTASSPASAGSATTSNWSSRWPRTGPSRSARSATTAAGRPLPGAPEPRGLLQGDGRRRHQPGDRPRARDRALLDPRRVRPAALDLRGRRGFGHDRDRLSGDPRRPPRHGAALRPDLPPHRP